MKDRAAQFTAGQRRERREERKKRKAREQEQDRLAFGDSAICASSNRYSVGEPSAPSGPNARELLECRGRDDSNF